jgi:hypothetical protein
MAEQFTLSRRKASLALFIISLRGKIKLDSGLKEFMKVMGSILYFLKKNDVFSCFLKRRNPGEGCCQYAILAGLKAHPFTVSLKPGKPFPSSFS